MNQQELDEKVRQEIQHELRCLPGIEPGSVDIKVEDGVVILAGHVADPSERQAAEQLARRPLGVKSVINQLQVRRPAGDAQHEASLIRAVADAFRRMH